MKALIIRILRGLGLVPVGRYRVLAGQAREAEVRAKKLSKLVEDLRAESRDWKIKATDAVKQLKTREKDTARDHHRAGDMKRETERLKAEIKRLRAKDAELEALRSRVVDAERELTVAREQLMAVDVKLDILEGAANVLDERTRSVIADPVRERRTAV